MTIMMLKQLKENIAVPHENSDLFTNLCNT